MSSTLFVGMSFILWEYSQNSSDNTPSFLLFFSSYFPISLAQGEINFSSFLKGLSFLLIFVGIFLILTKKAFLLRKEENTFKPINFQELLLSLFLTYLFFILSPFSPFFILAFFISLFFTITILQQRGLPKVPLLGDKKLKRNKKILIDILLFLSLILCIYLFFLLDHFLYGLFSLVKESGKFNFLWKKFIF